MFTQSTTKHVVSRVNEEGGGGCGWELFLSRFLNSCIIHMSRVTQAIERPLPNGLCYRSNIWLRKSDINIYF